jgi:predicted DNA-binding transcriptional regulator YafY
MAYKSGFFSQFARKLRVFELLRGHREPMHLDTLAARFEVHPQTMRRDLHDLEGAGETIEWTKDEDDSNRTLVRLVSRSYMDVPITRSEAHTFAGTRRLWEPFKGTPFYDDMENLWKKIMDRLPAPDRKEVEEDRERFFFIPDGGTKNFEGKREIITTMKQAVMRRRVVSYKYKTARGKPRSGYMAPYSIGIHKNGIYVLGKLVRKTERRVKNPKRPPLEWARWPIERFEAVEYLSDWKFEVPADFRVDDHFDDWGIIAGGAWMSS